MSAQKLAKSVHARQEQLAPDQVNMAPALGEEPERLDGVPLRARDTMDEQFPTNALTAKSERDKIMEAKLALQDPRNMGYTQFGKLEAKDADFKWYQEKLAASEAANFQAWFAKNFDHMSPADKKIAKKLFPEFYAERKKTLKQNAKNLVRLAKIKLEGVEDMKDLQTSYLAETGRLDLGPLQNMLHPELALKGLDGAQARNYEQRKFVRGLLSPFRVFGEEALPLTPTTTGAEMRLHESSQFRQHVYEPDNQLYGIDGRGFPGFTGPNTNQGDVAWYKQLQAQL